MKRWLLNLCLLLAVAGCWSSKPRVRNHNPLLRMEMVSGIPLAAVDGRSSIDTADPVPETATDASNPMEEVAPISEVTISEAKRMAKERNLPEAVVEEYAAAFLSEGIPVLITVELLAMAHQNQLPPADVLDAIAVAKVRDLPICCVCAALKMFMEKRLPIAVVPDVLACSLILQKRGFSIKDVVGVFAAAYVKPLTEAALVEVAAITAVKGVPLAAVRKVVGIALEESGELSRFKSLDAERFSRLWEVKSHGLREQKRGNIKAAQELWNEYWALFGKDNAPEPRNEKKTERKR